MQPFPGTKCHRQPKSLQLPLHLAKLVTSNFSCLTRQESDRSWLNNYSEPNFFAEQFFS